MKARIYEIKSSAASNAEVLRDEENDRFFWNDLKFQDFEVGDRIFFVNKPGGWVLYTTIGEKDIATDQANGKASFSYDGHSYSVDDPGGRFGKFVRFDVLQESPIGADDEWTSLGSSEVNDLWRDGEEVDTTTTRMERIQQLKRIFRDGEGAKALAEIETMLGGAEPLVAQGVVVVDSGTWFEGSMADLQQTGHIVLWWSKRPVGVETTMAELRSRLDSVGHFDLYYTLDRKARYRARVIDFATEADYSAARWTENRTVAEVQERFEDYKGESPNGRMQQARIAFLVDRMERLDPTIPIHRFRFKNGPDGLTQDNMLPYTRLMKEPEWVNGAARSEVRNDAAERIRGEFRSYLLNTVKASARTVEQYLSTMSRLQTWFVEHRAIGLDYNIWLHLDDHVAAISEKLKGDVRTDWVDVNTRQNNSYQAPWHHWVRFLEYRNNGVINDAKPTFTMAPKDLIDHVHRYIGSTGFRFSEDEIANFYLALRTKPFVILAGISGTGKSQLPKLFAKAVGMKPHQVIQVAVRPDWTDGSDLLGYIGLNGMFNPKDLINAVKQAHGDPDNPYFFLLDEMNLARVEHYFSDFLSVIETREVKGGRIRTGQLLRPDAFSSAKNINDFPDTSWPENLFLIGTVNMDETTHAFSRKVLDRANAIEMNEVDLDWVVHGPAVDPLPALDNSHFRSPYIRSEQLSVQDRTDLKESIAFLRKVNEILEHGDMHFAYRVRDEAAYYLLMALRYKVISPEAAVDNQLMQKVLPRVHGSSGRVLVILIELLNLLTGSDLKADTFDYKDMPVIQAGKYPRSVKKIKFMLRRYDEDRFTSFWL